MTVRKSMNTSGGPLGATEPRKRGSQPGVARGRYKPRRIKAKEPQTPEELAELDSRAREYWRDLYDANVKVFAPEHGRYVSVRTYVPSMPDLEHDKHDTADESKTCRGCGLDWELSFFSPSRNGALGVGGKCKFCRADDARDYSRTPEGKVARARAQAKYRAAVKAEERAKKSKATFIEAASKTPAGRALLAAAGIAHWKDEKC